VPEAVAAIRGSVAVTPLDDIAIARVSGAGAWEALDRVLTSELRLRDGQLLHTLALDEAGRPFADVLLACDDEAFVLIADGPGPAAFADYLRRHTAGARDVVIEDASEALALVSLDGPYAWELLSLLAGADVVGLPYLTFFRDPRALCYRAGRTGEYGYGLLVPRAQRQTLLDELLRRGETLDAAPGSLEAIDHCALENAYFNIRREGREGATPIELQLQWRVSYRKNFVGSEALARLRASGTASRLTTLIAASPMAAGDAVTLADRPAGKVVNAARSATRGDWVALAMIDARWAHPGIDGFAVGTGGTSARSVTPPLVNNRSLHVSPQLHSYASRGEFTFPPLVRGGA
jgi:aminomethyltransferase